LIQGVNPKADVGAHCRRWQDDSGPLKTCDIIFGCVDSFAQRRELEVLCRRYLIPYLDVGMDVHPAQLVDEPPGLAGQVIASIPGGPCMACLGYLTEEKLGREAAKYGAAGPRPQVVWANGILASTAVGLAVDLLTGWTKTSPRAIYLSYRGNTGVMDPHIRLKYLNEAACPHYPADEIGDPIFNAIQ
jgi:hypothetical protein